MLKYKSKAAFPIDFLGTDIDTYKMWSEYKMTPELNGSNFDIDHEKPNSSLDISKDEELRETVKWTNIQPLFKKDHQRKRKKFDFLDYRLHFV